MRIVGVLLLIMLIITGIAFTALNSRVVELNYLIGSKALPLAAILLICLIVGVLVTSLIMGFSLIKLKAKNKWLESKLKRLQEQSTQVQH